MAATLLSLMRTSVVVEREEMTGIASHRLLGAGPGRRRRAGRPHAGRRAVPGAPARPFDPSGWPTAPRSPTRPSSTTAPPSPPGDRSCWSSPRCTRVDDGPGRGVPASVSTGSATSPGSPTTSRPRAPGWRRPVAGSIHEAVSGAVHVAWYDGGTLFPHPIELHRAGPPILGMHARLTAAGPRLGRPRPAPPDLTAGGPAMRDSLQSSQS